jgi:hypothetical protein
MKRIFTAAAFLLLCAATMRALEAKEGLVKIVVNETTARISVYRLTDIAKARYEPLIFDQDPRTSFVTLSADGRQSKLGDAADFRVATARTDTGIRIEFRSSSCVVRQLLDFAKSEGASLADGLRVTFEIENISERDMSLGLRYLIDTWLGEKSGAHFALASKPRVAEETAITPSSEDAWVSSPGDKASFMVQFAGPGVDRPDKVILANWKRISDSSWDFDVNALRNFTLVPYSINDSAIALFWNPVSVARGGSRRIAFAMGSFNEKGYPTTSGAKTSTEQIFESTVLESSSAPNALTSMSADLVAARDLISRIDRAIAAGGAISDDELTAWRKILDRLEERKKGY